AATEEVRGILMGAQHPAPPVSVIMPAQRRSIHLRSLLAGPLDLLEIGMARSVVRCLLLLAALGAAGVAHAGTVYVPAPGLSTLGGSTYEVQVSITNTALAARDTKQTLLANDTDGTVRSGTPSTVQVQPGRTAVVKAAATFRG